MTFRHDQPLTDLKNIGPTSARWLRDVGIFTSADLEEVGAVGAYHRVKARGYKTSLNLVYALQGALLAIHWTDLPAKVRNELRRAVENLPE